MRRGILLIPILLLLVFLLPGCTVKDEMTISNAALSLIPEETYQLTAVCSDDGHKACEWRSSDESVVRVSTDGLVTAVAEGKASVYAVCKGGEEESTAVCQVTVSVCSIKLTFDNSSSAMKVGETATLSARVLINDAQTIETVQWSVSGDRDAADVTFDGNSAHISAKKVGVLTLTATYQRGSAPCSSEYTVAILSDINYRVTLSDTSIALYPGEKGAVGAVVTGDGEELDCPVTWSSADRQVATVSADGVITAVGPGSTVVTASASPEAGSKITAPCLVTVYKNDYTITITAEGESIYASDTLPLSVEVTKNNEIIKAPILWSVSDSKVAIVDDGVLTGLSAGRVTVTAEYISVEGDSYTAQVEIEVLANEYAITLPSAAAELDKGETLQLAAQLSRNGKPYDGNIIWKTSDESIAEVVDGLVIAKEAGTVTISAVFIAPVAEGGSRYEASVSLKIVDAVYTFTISPSDVSVYVGAGVKLGISAGRNDTVIQAEDINFSVANGDIASVSDGVVLGIAPGSTVITASWTDPRGGEHIARCSVTVASRYYMTVEPTTAELGVGEEIQIIATTMQRFDDGTVDECYIGAVEWRSSDTGVATVRAGVVVIHAPSDTSITITAEWTAPDGVICTAECVITVLPTAEPTPDEQA